MNEFKKGFIYLATPYSHSDYDVMQARVDAIEKYVAECLRDGEIIYSPILHHHQMAINHKLPTDWPFWRKIDGNMLLSAAGMRVLRLEGWEKSVGVQAEICIALCADIPIHYAEPV